jgi:hypothetical protein
MDEFVPPAFEIPALILVSFTVESVTIKDIEEHVIVEFADSQVCWWSMVSLAMLQLNGWTDIET